MAPDPIRRLCRLLALVATVAAAPVGAAAPDSTTSPRDTVYTMPPIVVEAPRVPVAFDDVFNRSGFVTVVPMQARRSHLEDLSTVLSQTVGVRVRQYGGLGSFATVSIRGSSSNQVDVYLDGVPLGDAYAGVTNLGDLPLDGVERVEVFRGAVPPHLGSAAIGGAINLVTPDGGGGEPRANFDTSVGSWGTARQVMSLWSPLPADARLFLHGSYMRSDGDFEFVDEVTESDPNDDVTTTRVNNDFDAWHMLGRASIDVPRAGSVAVGYNGVLREQGVPGKGSDQSDTARSERAQHVTYAKWALPAFLDKRVRVDAGGYFSNSNERFNDPGGDIALLPESTDNTFRAAGGSARVTVEAPVVPIVLETRYEGRRETFIPRDLIPQPREGPDRYRTTHQAVASADLYLFRQDLVLTAAEHFLWQETEFYDAPMFPWLPPSPQGRKRYDERTPRFGARWHPTPWLTVKGNWGRYVRQPTMLELFGNVGSVTGSDVLVPESGTNRDIGIALSRDFGGALQGGFLEVVYLYNDVDDLILFFPNSQSTARPENIGSARIRGWEVSFSTQWRAGLRLSGNYTYLDSRDTSDIPYYRGNELPSRPRHDATLFADYAWRRWRGSYAVQYIGGNYLDPANMQPVPERVIHNASVEASFYKQFLSVTVGGANLGNNRISDVGGFPLPGRSFYVTLSFRS